MFTKKDKKPDTVSFQFMYLIVKNNSTKTINRKVIEIQLIENKTLNRKVN